MRIPPVRDLITDTEMDNYFGIGLLSVTETKTIFGSLTGFIKKHKNLKIEREKSGGARESKFRGFEENGKIKV